MYPLTRLACLLGFGLLFSCGGAEDRPVTPDALEYERGPGLLLIPEQPRALVGRDFRLAFLSGGRLDGKPVARLGECFDPFVARVGGYQDNALEPVVGEDGRVGVVVRLPTAGDAMVGFSTVPRELSWQGEQVRFTQHVKSLFFVTQTAAEVPVSSAAMSYRIGQTLEIVPMVDPLPLLPNALLPLQVRYDGPPLAGAEIQVHCLSGKVGAEVEEVLRGRLSDVGTIDLRITRPGRYLVSVVHDPGGGSGADREVHLACLTFVIGEMR